MNVVHTPRTLGLNSGKGHLVGGLRRPVAVHWEWEDGQRGGASVREICGGGVKHLGGPFWVGLLGFHRALEQIALSL
jgi:hypothetical protein